jgi:gentisate 1,2-dioxygenase
MYALDRGLDTLNWKSCPASYTPGRILPCVIYSGTFWILLVRNPSLHHMLWAGIRILFLRNPSLHHMLWARHILYAGVRILSAGNPVLRHIL